MRILNMKWRFTWFCLGFLILVTVIGCAGFGHHLESPRIKMAHIQVKEIKVLETVFEIQLRVFNTNDVALQVKGIECELELNSEPFALGVSKTEIEIPPYDTQIVPIVVYSSVIDMVKGIHGLQKNEQLNYLIKGKIRLGANAFPSVLPFASEGNVSFKDLVESP